MPHPSGSSGRGLQTTRSAIGDRDAAPLEDAGYARFTLEILAFAGSRPDPVAAVEGLTRLNSMRS